MSYYMSCICYISLCIENDNRLSNYNNCNIYEVKIVENKKFLFIILCVKNNFTYFTSLSVVYLIQSFIRFKKWFIYIPYIFMCVCFYVKLNSIYIFEILLMLTD